MYYINKNDQKTPSNTIFKINIEISENIFFQWKCDFSTHIEKINKKRTKSISIKEVSRILIRITIRSPRYEKWDARSRISSFHAASWGFCRLQLLSEHEQYRGVAGFMLAHGGAPISSTSGRQPFTLLLAPQKLNWLDMLKLKNKQRALINYYKSLVVTLAATSTEIVFLPGSWLPVTVQNMANSPSRVETLNWGRCCGWVENFEMAEKHQYVRNFDTCQVHIVWRRA